MKRILIVDDEENILYALKLSLSQVGYNIATAVNGKDALEQIMAAQKAANFFHLIILDIRMPVMDGLELLSAMQKVGIHIPFIVMTGFGSKEMAIDLLRKGCADYLDKPFTPDELISRVKAVVGGPADERVSRAAIPVAHDAVAHKVAVSDGWVEISPAGDITVHSAENLRGILVEMLERGNSRFRFNLANVNDMDIAGLSLFLLFGKMMADLGKENRLEVVNAKSEIAIFFNKTSMGSYYSFNESTGR